MSEGFDSANAEAPEATVEVVESWRDNLSDDLQGQAGLQDIKDVNGLAKMYLDTKAMTGNSFRFPTSEAGQEDIDKFSNRILEHDNLGLMRVPDMTNEDARNALYTKMGRPEDVGGYALPEGVDAEGFGKLASTAHELGLTADQYTKLTEAYMTNTNETLGSMETERQAGVDVLKGEWGLQFEEKGNRALDMVRKLGGHNQLENAMVSGSIDADTLRLLDTVASQLGAEGSPMAKQMDSLNQADPSELRQKRADITNRLLTENLTNQQRNDLQKRLVGVSEDLLKTG